MTARVISLNSRQRRQHCAAPRRERLSWVHEWNVSATVMLKIDPGAIPNVACALWRIDVDALRRSYEVAVTRDDWTHSTIFQGKPQPNETREDALRREGAIILLNEILSASYGVPA